MRLPLAPEESPWVPALRMISACLIWAQCQQSLPTPWPWRTQRLDPTLLMMSSNQPMQTFSRQELKLVQPKSLLKCEKLHTINLQETENWTKDWTKLYMTEKLPFPRDAGKRLEMNLNFSCRTPQRLTSYLSTVRRCLEGRQPLLPSPVSRSTGSLTHSSRDDNQLCHQKNSGWQTMEIQITERVKTW